jgi:hypothetical protein
MHPMQAHVNPRTRGLRICGFLYLSLQVAGV